ncbi:MAG: hypothetical protein IH940_01250 [Acidobacteria bacterium]|nr:hypothetical protein [Acidobacteriota bacterium]
MIGNGSDPTNHPLDRVVPDVIRKGGRSALLVEPHVQLEFTDGQIEIRRVAPQIGSTPS